MGIYVTASSLSEVFTLTMSCRSVHQKAELAREADLLYLQLENLMNVFRTIVEKIAPFGVMGASVLAVTTTITLLHVSPLEKTESCMYCTL